MAKNRNERKPKSPPASPPAPPADTFRSLYDPYYFWRCPYLVKGCSSSQEHDAHPSALEILKGDISQWQIRAILEKDDAPVYDAYLALKSRDDYDLDTQVSIIRWLSRSRYTGDKRKEKEKALEEILSTPNLPSVVVKEIAIRAPLSPETFMALVFQERMTDRIMMHLLHSQRGFILGDREVRAFITQECSGAARVAVALMEVKAFKDAAELSKAAQTTLNTLNKDRETGVELIEGLADSYADKLEDLGPAAREFL